MGAVAVLQDIRAREVRLGTAARAMGGVAERRFIVGQDASLDLGLAAMQLIIKPDVVFHLCKND